MTEKEFIKSAMLGVAIGLAIMAAVVWIAVVTA